MKSKLEQLREMTVVVADTGDIDAIRTWKPVDCTTNPTLLLKAVALSGLHSLLEEVLAWGRKQSGDRTQV
ncbi:MAG TPA: transaldolase family protein, partial [Steroidobacteraceae bacterium]|nr:transaldolase family protein [Steroidobacteraceae bacterium]